MKTLIIISASLMLCACGKKFVHNGGSPTENLVTASVAGSITDLDDVPVVNAAVAVGTLTTTTDGNGGFTIKDAQLDQNAGLVKVTMPGYFDGLRTFLVRTGAINNVKIQLIPKLASGSFDAASGGTVTVTGGGSVVFMGGFVSAGSAAAYSGNVTVATFYLNPAAANFNKFMPGDLRGINTSNQQSILKAFGMAAVELDDASGEKLQLASGKTATITLPIPSTMSASAPATIPLWYFDSTTGFWKQQGSATKQGSNYVGTVSHFSFWVAGELTTSVKLTATFTMDTSGIGYPNKLVTLSRPDSTSSSAYTDSSGTVSGLVPAGEILTMKVFNDCGENIYSQNIGPFSGDTVLGSISVENGSCYSTDSTQYINLSFGGNNYYWPSGHISENFTLGSFTGIFGGSPQDTANSSTFFEGLIYNGDTTTGNYAISLYVIVNGNMTYQAGGQVYDPTFTYPTTTVTRYDPIGGYIEGTFSGLMGASPVSGSYRVKRTQ